MIPFAYPTRSKRATEKEYRCTKVPLSQRTAAVFPKRSPSEEFRTVLELKKLSKELKVESNFVFYPELSHDKLLSYYFRGLIDGDGCIHKNGAVSIYSGSLEFISDVQKILIDRVNLKSLKIYSGTSYFITWSSRADREKIFHKIQHTFVIQTFTN